MTDSDQFSPGYKSPASAKEWQRSGQGNLTGHLRKVKDVAADVHNALDKWETLSSQGLAVLTAIVNIQITFIYQQNEDTEAEEEQMTAKTLSEKLEPKCQALQLTVESMEQVVGKLCSLKSMVLGLRSLCQHRGEEDEILFTSWTIHHFGEAVGTLHDMYAKDLSLKKQLSQNVALADTRSKLMFYSAAWLHQPFVVDSKAIMTDLLQETGHTS